MIDSIKSVFKNKPLEIMFSSFLIKIIGVFLSFLLNIILVKIMGIEEYGRYNYIISLVNFFSILAIFGLDNAGVKYLTKYYSKKDFVNFKKFYSRSESFVLRTSISIIIVIILSMCFSFSDSKIKFYTILISTILIPLKSLASIYFSALRALERLFLYLSLNLIIRPTALIFLILILNQLISYKIDTSAFMILNIIIYLLIIIFTKSHIKNLLPGDSLSEKNNFKTNLLYIPFYIFFIQSVQLFNLSIDNIIINYFEGLIHVSLFSVASNIASVVGFALNSINIFLAPTISNYFHNNRLKDLQNTLRLVAKINLVFGIICTITIIMFGEMFLRLYDDAMIESYPLILILIVGYLFHVCCGSVTYLMIMTKLEKVAALITGFCGLLNIILNILLIPKYGLIGCSISTTISLILYNILASIIIIKKLKLNPTVFTIFIKQ